MQPTKKSGIELVFIKGNRIQDSFNILEARGRKMVKGIAIQSLEEFPKEEILYNLLEAIGIDEADYLAKQK